MVVLGRKKEIETLERDLRKEESHPPGCDTTSTGMPFSPSLHLMIFLFHRAPPFRQNFDIIPMW